MTAEPMLKPPEAAQFLGVAVATLARWRWAGVGPTFIKIHSGVAGGVRYDPVHLRAWLDAQTRSSTKAVAT